MDKDILQLIALKLNERDILNFSLSEKRIYKYVFENNIFWRNKLYKDYPFSKVQSKNFRNLYVNIRIEIRKVTTLVYNDNVENSEWYRPTFICNELKDFLLSIDFGYIKNTKIPLTYILFPLLSKGIFCQNIAVYLLMNYLRINRVEKDYYCSTAEMDKHLEKYYSKINGFDKNKFTIITLFNEIKIFFLHSELKNIPYNNLYDTILKSFRH